MKKLIKSIIMALLTYLSILIYFKIIFKETSYNFLLTIIFFILWYFYYHFKPSFDKRTKRFSLIISITISLILIIGSIVSSYIYAGAINIFDLVNIIYTIIGTIGLTLLFYRITGFCLLKLKKISITEKHSNMSTKTYFLIILIIFLGTIPYFLRYYPAIMTPDSYYTIHYANNFILSDFHTFGHTWFFGTFFHLGKAIFGNLNSAVALANIIQMIIMSTIFATAIKFLYNLGLKRNLCLLILLMYTLNPLHTHYSITLWRDIIFGGSFVIIIITVFNFIKEPKISVKNIILFIISILLMLFFRNNGIYIFLFMIPFLIIGIKDKRKLITILTISLAVFYFIIKGPVFDYFNVKKTTSVEAFSIPLQQLSRTIASGREIDGNDLQYLRKLFNYDLVKEKYTPTISDPIKNITSNEILTNDKISFARTYLHLFFKYPNVYIESYFLQTLGYWYPDVIYWATAGESESIFDTEKVASRPLTNQKYNQIIDKTTSRKIPLNNLIWSIGSHFLILLISSFIICYFKNEKYLLTFIPLYGLWISLMLSTPVFCELRYIYGLFTCTPLIIFIPILLNNKERKIINEN